MAKTDWAAVAAMYERDREKTGISAKDWCDARGINYASARRYLKSRGQSSDESATFQAAAQSAQKKVRKSAQNRKSAQPEGNAQKRKSEKTLRKSGDEDTPAADEIAENKGRDAAGRFVAGEYEGNPNPPANIKPGMQLAKTHGGYARFFDDQEPFQAADEMMLMDELRLCRARVVSVTKTMNEIAKLLMVAESVESKAELYGQMLKAEQAMERNICRVESITKTLSSLRIDDVTVPKVIADTERIKAATRKLEAEANKLERDEGGDATPISEMVADLQDIGTGGLMSGG